MSFFDSICLTENWYENYSDTAFKIQIEAGKISNKLQWDVVQGFVTYEGFKVDKKTLKLWLMKALKPTKRR